MVNDLSSEKQGRPSTIQDRYGKCLNEEQEALSKWTEYCSELYSYESCCDNVDMGCSQSPEEDLRPIFRQEFEIAVASLKHFIIMSKTPLLPTEIQSNTFNMLATTVQNLKLISCKLSEKMTTKPFYSLLKAYLKLSE